MRTPSNKTLNRVRRAAAKRVQRTVAAYYTIGARFLDGPNVTRVYTYRVRKGVKVHLGQALVVDTPFCLKIVVAVRIDVTLQDNEGFDYKYVTQKVAPL